MAATQRHVSKQHDTWQYHPALTFAVFFPKDVSSEDCWRISYRAYQYSLFHTYRLNTYPFNTYPCNTYPFNTYRLKIHIHSVLIPSIRIDSIRIRSILIHSKRIHSICIQITRIHSIRIHSIVLHQQESPWMWTKHFRAYHCITRNGNEYKIIACHFISLRLGWQWKKHFAYLYLSAYHCIARVWTCNSLLAIGVFACLPFACLCACLLL